MLLNQLKLKKANGKEATYYYLKSGNNKVKGWIWKGNLSKVVVSTNNNTNNNTSNSGSSGTTQPTNDYAQQKSDISNMLSIVRTMYSQDQDDVLADFKDITPKEAYDSSDNDLSEVISDMGYAVDDQDNDNGVRMDAQAIQNAYQLFANRFPSLTSIKLAALSSRLSDTLSGKSSDDVSEAADNLADELSDAVLNLQS